LLKQWSLGVGRATIGKAIFACVYIENNLFLQNLQANFNHTSCKSSFGEENKKLSKKRVRFSLNGR
jgi:hypothetical protein